MSAFQYGDDQYPTMNTTAYACGVYGFNQSVAIAPCCNTGAIVYLELKTSLTQIGQPYQYCETNRTFDDFESCVDNIKTNDAQREHICPDDTGTYCTVLPFLVYCQLADTGSTTTSSYIYTPPKSSSPNTVRLNYILLAATLCFSFFASGSASVITKRAAPKVIACDINVTAILEPGAGAYAEASPYFYPIQGYQLSNTTYRASTGNLAINSTYYNEGDYDSSYSFDVLGLVANKTGISFINTVTANMTMDVNAYYNNTQNDIGLNVTKFLPDLLCVEGSWENCTADPLTRLNGTKVTACTPVLQAGGRVRGRFYYFASWPAGHQGN